MGPLPPSVGSHGKSKGLFFSPSSRSEEVKMNNPGDGGGGLLSVEMPGNEPAVLTKRIQLVTHMAVLGGYQVSGPHTSWI